MTGRVGASYWLACGALFAGLSGCAERGRMLVGAQLAEAGSAQDMPRGGEGPTGGGGPAGGGLVSGGSNAAGGSASIGGSASLNCVHHDPAASPAAGDVDVEHYVAAAPLSLAVPPDEWGGLGGAFDVNGDGVSDVLFRDAARSRYRLLVSTNAPQALDLREVECETLAKLPVGRLFLRDLDADGALDFVIGLPTRIVAFLNHRASVQQVLDFALPGDTERLQLINLDTIDLDRDGKVDLVVGFDRLQSEAELTFDTGVLSLFQRADNDFSEADMVSSAWIRSPSPSGRFQYSGYVTAGRFRRDGTSHVIAAGYDDDAGEDVAIELRPGAGVAPSRLTLPELSDSVREVFALPTDDGLDLLAVVGDRAFHMLDLREAEASLMYAVPLAFTGGTTHELGGGPESPRYYFYDLDHDGDEDFLERSADYPRRLAIHVNLSNAAFAPPQLLDIGAASAAEAPFVDVGPARGVVDELMTSREGGVVFQPAIHTLASAAGAK